MRIDTVNEISSPQFGLTLLPFPTPLLPYGFGIDLALES